MTTLYIDRKNISLELDAGALVFRENGERIGTVPIVALQRIVLRGNATVDTSLLAKLGAQGIGIILLSGRKAEPSLFLPRAHNDATRRLAQYRAACDPAACLDIAREIVHQKLAAQISWLQEKIEGRPETRYELTHAVRGLEAMQIQITSMESTATLRGLEGAAANFYFSAYAAIAPASLNFHGRNRRPPRDPLNAILSLAYTLLHSEAVLAAHAAGLDPYIGFYHAPAFGRESLACDLVEAHRAEVDAWAIRLFNKQTLRAEDFSSTNEGCFLGKAGRTHFYQEWETLAEHLRRALDRQTRQLVSTLLPDEEVEDSPEIQPDFPDEITGQAQTEHDQPGD